MSITSSENGPESSLILIIHQTKAIMDYIHTKIWELTKTDLLEGSNRFVVFVDNYLKSLGVSSVSQTYSCRCIYQLEEDDQNLD